MSLHCGACMKDFDSSQRLVSHLQTCVASKAILYPYTAVSLRGEDKAGHPVGGLIWATHTYNHLIDRYAYAIAYDMNTVERAKIHRLLCEKLHLDYNTFKPFESTDIVEMPTVDEALKILWEALGAELRDRL